MATLSAIYKISADISNLQQGMTRAVQATESLDKTASRVSSTLTSVGKAFAGMVSVTAVAAAVRSFTNLTGHLTDLAAKTGISTTELQKLKYAAELSGGSLETVTRAIGIMARTLIEGDKSAVQAMKRLGLNIDDIRRMQPGQAFSNIADAIAKIESPMERSTLAMQLFGKSGAELLPMITGNLTDAMEAAERLGIVLDEDTVAAGDRLGDTFTTLTAVGQGVLGKVLAPLVPAIQMVADAMVGLGDIITWLQNGFQTLLKWGVQSLKFFVDAGVRVTELAGKVPILGRTMRDVDRAALGFGKSLSTWLGDMATGFDVVVPKAVKNTSTLAKTFTDIGTETRVSQKAVEEYGKALDKSAALGVKTFKEFHDAIKTINFEMGILVRERLNAFGETAQRTLSNATESTAEMIRLLTQGIPVVDGLGKEFEQIGTQIDVLTPKFTKTFGQNLTDTLATSLKQIPQILVSAFTGGGDIMGAIKGIASSVGASVGKVIGETFKTLGKFGGPIGEAIGSLAGPLISVFQKIFGSAGRDLVKDFASSMGGFDALRAKLSELGDQGERLWINLTQGVGRNNPEQAKAAIEAINKAFGAQGDQLARAMATAEKYGISLEQMGEKFRQSRMNEMFRDLLTEFDDLLFLGVDVNTIIEKMGGSIIDFVQTAIRTGTEVPQAMRPMLEKMAEMGMLVDDTGAAMFDLAEINWAKSMTEGFKDVVEAINRVASALGYVFDTFDNQVIDIPVNYTHRGDPASYVPLPDEGDFPSFARGSGGIRDFGSGTLAMLHGREAIVTESQMGGTIIINNTFTDPVYAYDETNLARQAARLSEVTVQSLKTRGVRIRTA